jgi:tetratricopeptide (TPR) repeat protein
MQEAEVSVSSKKYKEALKLYQEAINIQPNHSMSLVYGADILMRLGRKHEALHWFQKALKLHPKHVDSNFITANILQEQNKLGLALQHLEY